VSADADRRLAVAYVMNMMLRSAIVWPIAATLAKRVYDIVGS